MTLDFNRYTRILDQINPIKVNGTVSEIIGLMVEGHGPASSVGEMCNIFANGGACETRTRALDRVPRLLDVRRRRPDRREPRNARHRLEGHDHRPCARRDRVTRG